MWQASTPVVGAGVLLRMFMAEKSVCVSSLLTGPRSLFFGGAAWRRIEVLRERWGRTREFDGRSRRRWWVCVVRDGVLRVGHEAMQRRAAFVAVDIVVVCVCVWAT